MSWKLKIVLYTVQWGYVWHNPPNFGLSPVQEGRKETEEGPAKIYQDHSYMYEENLILGDLGDSPGHSKADLICC